MPLIYYRFFEEINISATVISVTGPFSETSIVVTSWLFNESILSELLLQIRFPVDFFV